MQDFTGRTLERYEIIEKQGCGCLGCVYRANDTILKRAVAVKFLDPALLAPHYRQDGLFLFEREAQAFTQLAYPHIVSVFDYGHWENTPYLIMQFLPGGGLKKHLQQGSPIEFRRAVRLAAVAARALDYGHRQNMIHRNVHPDNILLTDEQEPILCDFGLLKLRDPNPEMGAGPLSLYHPPEHAAGKFLPQGDQYALAVVLFEMITGQLPKSRQGAPPNEPPFISARSILPSIPEEMEWVLFRALSPDPQERYPHTSMFAEDLEQILRGKPVIAAPGFMSASHSIPPPDSRPREEIAQENLPEVSPLESVLLQAARPRSNPSRKMWWWVALAIVLLGALAVWLYLYLW